MAESSSSEKPVTEPPPRAVASLERINHIVGLVESVFITAALAFLVLLGFYRSVFETVKKIAGRPVKIVIPLIKVKLLDQPPDWTTPTMLILVFFIGMLGLSMAAQSDKLINVDIFSRILKPKGKLVARILGNALAILVCIWLIRAIWHTRNILNDTETTGKLLSDKTAQLTIPLTLGLVILHLAIRIGMDVGWLAANRTPPPETVAGNDISPQSTREGGA